MKGVLIAASICLSCAAAAAQGAQAPVADGTGTEVAGPNGEAIRLTRIDPDRDPIRIDGSLDEPIWQRLPAYGRFLVIEPDTLAEPSHETELMLAYDDRGLYVGARMKQPADTLIARLSGRDSREVVRDGLSVTLDTSGEGRYGYWFGVNLGDSLMDGTVLPERKFSSDWDGPWRGRSQETADGWTAELFIPWSVVSMPASGKVRRMGLYASRKVAYLDERWGWPALPDTQAKFMSELQPVEMEQVAPRQQYNIYPFLAVSDDRIDDRVLYRAGADFFWRPSTNFQMTATVNPDFGNVESDDVVVNLSATETFFPEKRLFFLEGQEIFFAHPRADTRGRGVGMSGLPYTMINTRRIGGKPHEPSFGPGVVVPDRELVTPTDLIGAVKTTGQFGRFRYGVLGAFEEDAKFDVIDNGQPRNLYQDGNDYGVARLLYEDSEGGAYRALGILSTAVVNKDTRDAFVHGLDWHYLVPSGSVKMDGQVMTSDISDIGRGYGGILDFELTYHQGLVQRIGFEYFDEDFDMNDLGFLERNDHYQVRSSLIWTRSRLGWARSNEFDVRGWYRENLSEDLMLRSGLMVADRLSLNDLSQITARAMWNPKVYDDLNSFGNGTYRVDRVIDFSVDWDSDPSKAWSFGVGAGYKEEFLRGPVYTAKGSVTWRPSDRFATILGVTYMDRDGWLLHQQDELMATFKAKQWMPKLSVDYFISARQQVRLSLQWVGIRANEDEFYRIPDRPGDLMEIAKPVGVGFRPDYSFSVSQYSVQARYRWEIAPLSDIFVVYTRQADLAAALGDDDYGDIWHNAWNDPLSDVLVFKIRYRLGS
ncbi:MAG: DUF5916 domain-containing protein [Pseudomonadales bacterium]